ncbi:MAG: glycosyltransferase family 2 protein [Candidatus Aquirickettsiella gammari]|jgi:NDP-sugar pyrophosphorylase family protein
MLNIVVPMAGAGNRFVVAGYSSPKPLIPINGIPMVKLVINNLRPNEEHRFIFICQQAHIETYKLEEKLSTWAPGCQIIGLDGLTEGAACTVLAAKERINNTHPLMIANSDQYINADINKYLFEIRRKNLDGLIMTMKANDRKWSYVKVDKKKRVTCVVEKEVVSDEATVGIYNFKKGADFISAVEEMIAKDLRVNNEFYVAPSYNQLIKNHKQVGIFNIGKEGDGMYGLGTPIDLELFLESPIHKEATEKA